MAKKVLYFDIETHSVDDRWDMSPRDFFRLGQYAWGDGEIILTEDYDEMIRVIREADTIVGHNIHSFDLSVLFGVDSTEPLELTMQKRVFDTFVQASLVYSNPGQFTMRPKAEDKPGRKVFGDKPEFNKLWLSLDNLAYQLGIPGKIGDLKAMAKEFGGFGSIPLNNSEFLDYARQDVDVTRAVARALMHRSQPFIQYYWREQLNAAIDAQNTRNGWVVDVPTAQARVDELKARRDVVMNELVAKYDFPTEGKSPWASSAGKDAILRALADHGITPSNTPGWTKTATGNISLGGEVLIEITEGTAAEELGRSLAELKGQRSLAQLALDSTFSDGKVHPEITSLQRSGRKSTTKPGLTVWSARGPKAIEKQYFIADPGTKLFEMDYSQADARIVAAYSGDAAFSERFAEGSDSHEISGRLMYGDEVYDSNPYEYRQNAKALGHAYAYRAGAKTLAKTGNQPLAVAKMFVEAMDAAYPFVKKWQEAVTEEGEYGSVTNDWGRVMKIDMYKDPRTGQMRSSAFTQAPAMYGQSGTRELMVDALIRMAVFDIRIITWLKAQVHDALVFSIPTEHLGWAPEKIKDLMETTFKPKNRGSRAIHFPVGVGKPADNWYLAGH